jgi:hypothetical protein
MKLCPPQHGGEVESRHCVAAVAPSFSAQERNILKVFFSFSSVLLIDHLYNSNDNDGTTFYRHPSDTSCGAAV